MHNYNEDELIIGTPKFLKYKKLFAGAGKLAAKKTIRQGLPITYVENDKIIKKYPNGKIRVLGEAPKQVKLYELIIKLKKDNFLNVNSDAKKNNVATKRKRLLKKCK